MNKYEARDYCRRARELARRIDRREHPSPWHLKRDRVRKRREARAKMCALVAASGAFLDHIAHQSHPQFVVIPDFAAAAINGATLGCPVAWT
jgi:hypothetical protein